MKERTPYEVRFPTNLVLFAGTACAGSLASSGTPVPDRILRGGQGKKKES